MIKINKSKHYIVTFAHCLDDTDRLEHVVSGKAYFRLRNMLLDLGYESVKAREIE